MLVARTTSPNSNTGVDNFRASNGWTQVDAGDCARNDQNSVNVWSSKGVDSETARQKRAREGERERGRERERERARALHT